LKHHHRFLRASRHNQVFSTQLGNCQVAAQFNNQLGNLDQASQSQSQNIQLQMRWLPAILSFSSLISSLSVSLYIIHNAFKNKITRRTSHRINSPSEIPPNLHASSYRKSWPPESHIFNSRTTSGRRCAHGCFLWRDVRVKIHDIFRLYSGETRCESSVY
jgi:hypothetical protein